MSSLQGHKVSSTHDTDGQMRASCSLCHDLQGDAMPFKFQLGLPGSRKDSSCAGCEFLRTIVEQHPETGSGHGDTIDVHQCAWSLAFVLSYKGGFSQSLHVRAAKDTRCPWPSIPPFLAEDAPQSFFRSTATRIKSWIDVCDSHHKICQPSRHPGSRLPTRLLEIRGPQLVRLHVTSSEYDQPLYACLSHCWGGRVPLQTTKTTLPLFRDCIPWDELPLTFKHAVRLTHDIGLKYIWIDSLCIVQDDIQDWRREASSMARVYSGAYVTFAASGAADSTVGLYEKYLGIMEDAEFGVEADLDYVHSFQHPILAREEYKVHSRYAPSHPNTEKRAPLLQRAWFYQERMLSRRIVHFIDGFLYWECVFISTCELDSIDPLVREPFFSDSGPFASPEAASRIEHWRNIVKMYTSCLLTFAEDKLPALQGVAREIQDKRRCAYFAGLWEDTLVQDLAWRVLLNDEDAKSSQQTTNYIAPSWSWASIPAGNQISFLDPLQPACKVFAVSTTPAGDDPLGQVTAGILILVTTCVSGICESKPPSKSDSLKELLIYFNGSTWTVPWRPDAHSGVIVEKSKSLIALLGSPRFRPQHFLILSRVGDEGSGYFQRVGIMDMRMAGFAEVFSSQAFSMCVAIV